MTAMDSFDRAWSVAKQYSLDWRRDAQGLLDLDRHEVPRPLIDDDRNAYHPEYIGEGTKVATYQHPHDSRYVVKVPYSDDEWTQRHSQGRSINDNTVALLERLGYPIVGELSNLDRIDDISESIFVQPRLYDSPADDPLDLKNLENEKRKVAGATLMHLVGDRNRGNYGFDDSTGGARNFDLGVLGFTDDWMPLDYSRSVGPSRGEQFQEHLNTLGIQHPASRLLDEVLGEVPDISDKDRDNPLFRLITFRDMMEAIEPYSDNPRNLTVDGKPIWLEGLN